MIKYYFKDKKYLSYPAIDKDSLERQLHNTDGPAVVFRSLNINDYHEYWVDGEKLSEQLFWQVRLESDKSKLALYLCSPKQQIRTLAKQRQQELENADVNFISRVGFWLHSFTRAIRIKTRGW